MAKAGLCKSENPHYQQLGGCMREVQHAFGLTLQEFAAELGKNESQVRRQMEGSERPQIEAVFAVQRFQGPLVIALARLATGVEVDTVIHVRRTA
jgi:transcriptional regulator with XRE-family HTH domain